MRLINGQVYILDATCDRLGPTEADQAIRNRASQDGRGCRVRWEIESGASGIRDSQRIGQMLHGYDARGRYPEGDKIQRAKPLAAQAEAGNVLLVEGEWNERWLRHMHGQPDLPHDDEMDAASGAYNDLTYEVQPEPPRSIKSQSKW